MRFSPDGAHWSEPVKPVGFGNRAGDTHTNAFSDPAGKRYVCFTKHSLGEQVIARYESDDFLHWHGGDIVLRSSPEEGKKIQTYCLEVFPYGSGYLGYVMMYHASGNHAVDCELASSPDTIHWKRHCLPCLARLGMDRWCGYTDHTEPRTSEQKDGSLLTRPLKLTGEPLCVTTDAQGGQVRVTLVDAQHQSHPSDTPLDSAVTRIPLHFPGFSIEAHRGDAITLHFEIQNATLNAITGVELPDPSAAQ